MKRTSRWTWVLCLLWLATWVHTGHGQGHWTDVLDETPAVSAHEPAPQLVIGVFLGVRTSKLPEELTQHLQLNAGFGLLIEEVMPGSPAEKSGLKKSDVLTWFNDQQLAHVEQLQALVRASKEGEKVKLTYISNGSSKTALASLDKGPLQIVPETDQAAPAVTLQEMRTELARERARLEEELQKLNQRWEMLYAELQSLQPNNDSAQQAHQKQTATLEKNQESSPAR